MNSRIIRIKIFVLFMYDGSLRVRTEIINYTLSLDVKK